MMTKPFEDEEDDLVVKLLARGRAEALLIILETRSIAVTPAGRAVILYCDDLARLDKWIRKAVTVTSVKEMFASA